VTGPRPLGSAALVRLIASREISARVRDKNFIISSIVIIVLLVGTLGLQVVLNSGSDTTRVGVVGDPALEAAIQAQGKALDVDVTVKALDDEDAARAAIEDDDVDGVLIVEEGQQPELLVEQSAGGSLQAVVQGAVAQLSLSEQLASVGISALEVPEVSVTALDPQADQDGQRVVVAIIGIGVLYGLLILFGQFVAQGVVEEKASRVVELLLATMRPWQLLAGKVVGLGLLGLAQIVVITVVGVTGALAFDLVDIPGDLIGTAVGVVAWFVLGYAFYASAYACAGACVPRQEELQSATTPLNTLILISYFVAFAVLQNPDGTLAKVTSFIPITAPVTMPPRIALGAASPLEIVAALVVTTAGAALLVPLAARIYRGAVLRTGSAVKLRDAWRAAGA
jgi:ABC-2 type transport system permease protein